VGEKVKKGQVIGEATGFMSVPVHSSVSGKVIAIRDTVLPNGKTSLAVEIENDFSEESVPLQEVTDYLSLSSEEIKKRILAAGIVGLGGAGFPTHVKLSPPPDKKVDAILINGVECEPYLTADHRIMVERPRVIMEGLRILMKVLGLKTGYIGIELNKPDAVRAMKRASRDFPDEIVKGLHVKYPQGAEKMLIKAVTGREVPPGKLPIDVGVVVHNVGTAVAVYEAIRYAKPLIERVVTVSGEKIRKPKNLLCKIGTPLSDLIIECGGLKPGADRAVVGGPMMGSAVASFDVPVTKTTSGLLLLKHIPEDHEHMACIRCGRCIDSCPMGLMPSMLGILIEKGMYQETKEYALHSCFECGACTYACPSKRPMVQWIKMAKPMVKP
jgi:electron transport complex protein RnfC